MIFGWVLSALFGVFLGIILALFLIVKTIRKKINNQLIDARPYNLLDGHVKEINAIIKGKQKRLKKENRGVVIRQTLGLKKKNLKISILYSEIINDVAKVFNSTSENPMLEFSVKNAFDFLNEVTEKAEKVLNSINLELLKKSNLSFIIGVSEIVIKAKENRALKKITNLSGKVIIVLKLLNPYYWIKKIVQVVFSTMLVQELIFASVEIVGWTFAEFYHECN